MIFKESALAHELLDGLEGIEIGGAAHNPFGLNTRNVDFTLGQTIFKKEEIRMCGQALPVDIAAPGDQLPLEDDSVDFVVSSHAIHLFPDPIKALKEWHRVVRSGGYIYVIVPHRDRTFTGHSRTTLAELIERHDTGICPDPESGPCTAWITEDFVELIKLLGWPIAAIQDVDDKVGNGFTVVIRVQKQGAEVLERAERRRLSISFLMGPTGSTRTGGPACMLEYARRFQERGHNVSISTWPQFLWQGSEPFPNLGFHIPIHYDRKVTSDSLPFHVLRQSPRDYLGELNFFVSYLKLLTPVIPKSDLLIAVNWDSIIPGWESGKGKVVHFPQHYDEVFFTLDRDATDVIQSNPLIKMLCRTAFQMPCYRVANSTWLARQLERRLGETVPVVTHGIDTARFTERPKLSAADGICRIVTYSRPEKWKGFADAVAAMGGLMRRYPGRIEWNVYGFPHAIGSENPYARYRFHGSLGHDELSKLYAESDIVLCPSWYESFPLPPIEAMACGTAVVTTCCGTEDYAIDGHTALVVRPRVVGDMTAALDALVRMPDLRHRLARNGRAMAESLTWDAAVAAREELLWRIHRNELPNQASRCIETGIEDGYGHPFEEALAEMAAKEGELLIGPDGRRYMVDSGRIRRLTGSMPIESKRERAIDPLMLLRNEMGPAITSLANYYGVRQPLGEPDAIAQAMEPALNLSSR